MSEVDQTQVVKEIEGHFVSGRGLILLKSDAPPDEEWLRYLHEKLKQELDFRGVIICTPQNWVFEKMTAKDTKALYEKLKDMFEGTGWRGANAEK